MYFDTAPNALSSNFQYQRYSNINDEGNRFIVDNVYMDPIIDYTLAPSGIYGINAKDFNRIEYTNIESENNLLITLKPTQNDKLIVLEGVMIPKYNKRSI
jgi:hypothetical protein